MEYRYLKAFLLTAKHLSFSKAAQDLNIAQSAISRQIKLLEEGLNQELLIRSSKKILLTDKGRELFLLGSKFDQDVTHLLEKEDQSEVNVGILDGLVDTWFSGIVSAFYKKYQRNMKISVADKPELVEGIESGRFDIIFSTDNIQSELVSSLKLFSENFVLISKDQVNTKKLNEYRWIVFGDLDKIYTLTKKVSNNIISIGSITTIVSLVKNGVGIAVVPEHILKKKDNIVVNELTTSLPKSDIYMTTLSFKKLPKHISEVYEIIKKNLEK